MTTKTDFTAQEWEAVLQAPLSAGMMVVTAQRGGTFRETFAIGKAYAEARQRHGESELLDEVVASKPRVDHERYESVAELDTHVLGHIRTAVAAVAGKATPAELDGYRGFVMAVAERVAQAHREDGVLVSHAEQAALDSIAAALDRPASTEV